MTMQISRGLPRECNHYLINFSLTYTKEASQFILKKKKDGVQFALDILTIPGASADVEAIFSELGDMLEPHQARLQPDFLAAAQCNQNWEQNGFIKK